MAALELFKEKSKLATQNLIYNSMIIFAVITASYMLQAMYKNIQFSVASTAKEKQIFEESKKILGVRTDPSMTKNQIKHIHQMKDTATRRIEYLKEKYYMPGITNIGKISKLAKKNKKAWLALAVFIINYFLFAAIFYFLYKKILNLKENFFFVSPVREKVLKLSSSLENFKPSRVFIDPVGVSSFFYSKQKFLKLLREMEAQLLVNCDKFEMTRNKNYRAIVEKEIYYNHEEVRALIEKSTSSFLKFLSFTGMDEGMSIEKKKRWRNIFNFVILHKITGLFMNFPTGLINSYLKDYTLKYVMSSYGTEKGIVTKDKRADEAVEFLKAYIFWLKKSESGKWFKTELLRFDPIQNVDDTQKTMIQYMKKDT